MALYLFAIILYMPLYSTFNFYYLLFFIFWLRWVFVAVHGLSLVRASGSNSSLRCTGFSCSGFSCCGARALGARDSVVATGPRVCELQ